MIDAIQEPEPLPPLPPNSAVLAVRPGPDKVHTILRLTFDVTHLSEDGQKLLTHMTTDALTKFEKTVVAMNRLEVARSLAKIERTKKALGNGQ